MTRVDDSRGAALEGAMSKIKFCAVIVLATALAGAAYARGGGGGGHGGGGGGHGGGGLFVGGGPFGGGGHVWVGGDLVRRALGGPPLGVVHRHSDRATRLSTSTHSH